MKKPYMIEFPQHGDDRGWLVVAEGCKDVPFDIRRIFYIYGSDSQVVRGKHANRNSEFVLVNVAGTCKVKVTDLSTGGGVRCILWTDPTWGSTSPPGCGRKCTIFLRTASCCACPAMAMTRRNTSAASRNMPG